MLSGNADDRYLVGDPPDSESTDTGEMPAL